MSSDSARRSSQAYDQQVLAKIGGGGPGQQTAAGAADQPMLDMHNTLSRLNGQLLNFGKFLHSIVVPETT